MLNYKDYCIVCDLIDKVKTKQKTICLGWEKLSDSSL